MAAIELRGVVRRHPGAAAPAVAHLDLHVDDGEFLVLVGPSGCGKSTTLRMIAGLDAPDAGSVHLGGRDITHLAPQDRDVAMVFQGYALYPHLTVREILAFPLRMRRVPRPEQERRVGEAAELLGLGRLLDRRPGELSGGERQRVAMGRAIVRSPRVFLFDEPLSNLDAALRAELRVELGALVRRLGVTSVYVTHDQVEAMTLGTRIAVMAGGVLQQLDAPRALYERPANLFVASFLGTPSINRLPGLVRRGAVEVSGVTLPLTFAGTPPERVVVALRPEHLRVTPAQGDAAEPGGDCRAGPAPALHGTVTHSEPLGAETLLHVATPGATLVARLPGWAAFESGAAVRCALDPARCLVFDAESGRRLELTEAPGAA